MNKAVLSLLALALPVSMFAQSQGTLSGDLQTNLNFFQKDEKIGAAGNPLYDNYLSGGEAWLSVRYNVNNWTFTSRFDAFHNSNLLNPSSAMTAYGLGAYSITKEMDDLTVTVGSIYDQIGSGILFRSYEDRGLLIDNGLMGLGLKYKLPKQHLLLKAFGGQQRYAPGGQQEHIYELYNPIIAAINAEGDYTVGKANITPGVGILNRTLDAASMTTITSNINSQELNTRFEPRYNMYAFSAYNTLNYKSIQWFIEGDYKTHEAIPDTALGTTKLVDKPGNVVFTTLNYARKGFAVNVSAKRTENFFMRTSPNEVLLKGMLNWQPVVARQRPERLISRYTPASQDLSEMASTVDVLYNPSEKTTFTFTYTNIDRLDKSKLYRELFGEVVLDGLGSWKVQAGAQYLEYNMTIYRTKPQPFLFAITPYVELTYLINGSQSLRMELQYMNTKQDYGSWVFGLLEYNVAPKFSLSVSDMYNIKPNYENSDVHGAYHYPSIYGAFSKGPHRFSLAYVKQVAGINCTGGVCRYEPAFSGIKATLNTRF